MPMTIRKPVNRKMRAVRQATKELVARILEAKVDVRSAKLVSMALREFVLPMEFLHRPRGL